MKKNIAETVCDIVTPYASQLGVEVYDVEYVKEGADWFLRIYIDKPDGISSDDCEAMSRLIDPVLDEHDPISNSYYLEVSSVGLERPLKIEKDNKNIIKIFCSIAKRANFIVDVRLYKAQDGLKEFCGKLCDYADGDFTIELESGKKVTINVKSASLIRPHIDF